MTTRDMDEAVRLGDQVAILRAGALAQVGTPQELLEGPADAYVAGVVGRDRGYRSLQFRSADQLGLDRVKVVRDLAAARGAEPTLILDADAKPVGWADPTHPGQLRNLGSTFRPESDTLRVALDSALTSPFGLAVAVDLETGRYAGVVNATTILGQAHDAHSPAYGSVGLKPEPEPEAIPGRRP